MLLGGNAEEANDIFSTKMRKVCSSWKADSEVLKLAGAGLQEPIACVLF